MEPVQTNSTFKALIIIDMTNDFVFEEYEYQGNTYQGKLVAPLGKTIIGKLVKLIDKIVNNGTVSVFRIPKDHLNAFKAPELELKIAELGINEVFLAGLVEEVCIYINSLSFLERGFKTNIIRGCTAPFEAEKGKKALEELKVCGVNFVDDIPDDIKVILLLEDEHDEDSEEIVSGAWPPHNMKGSPGALTVKEIREALDERIKA